MKSDSLTTREMDAPQVKPKSKVETRREMCNRKQAKKGILPLPRNLSQNSVGKDCLGNRLNTTATHILAKTETVEKHAIVEAFITAQKT